MTSAHLTSNSMLCDNTFLCPRRLFSSPISSWLRSPQPRKATKLSLFQPPGVYKEPGMGQIYQSHLCCCLDNTSPRLALTSASAAASGCWMPRPEELVPVSPYSCPPRGPQLFHSQVNFTSQECACQVHLLTFTQKSLHLWRICLQVHLLTFTQKSLHLSRTCLQMHLLTLTQKSLHLWRMCLQVHLLTFTHKSLRLSRTCFASALLTFTHKSLR